MASDSAWEQLERWASLVSEPRPVSPVSRAGSFRSLRATSALLQQADVVCVVYDVSEEATVEKVSVPGSRHWCSVWSPACSPHTPQAGPGSGQLAPVADPMSHEGFGESHGAPGIHLP